MAQHADLLTASAGWKVPNMKGWDGPDLLEPSLKVVWPLTLPVTLILNLPPSPFVPSVSLPRS
jgi:hypothetical protein